MIFNEEANKSYNLYFSHSWNYEDSFTELEALLNSKTDFSYINSFIRDDHPTPIISDERALYENIRNKMKHSQAVLLLCGVYPLHSRWINKEIIACKDEMNKPLIAIEKYDSSHTSFLVKQSADIIVNWNAIEIVNAVKQLS